MAKKQFTRTIKHYLAQPDHFNKYRKLIRYHGRLLDVVRVGWENGSRDIYVRLLNGTTIDNLSTSDLLTFEEIEEK